MNDILRIPFDKQQFPDCAQEMLRVIDKVIWKWKTFSSSRLFTRDLQATIDRYLFCLMETKGAFSTKLSAVQELQLIDMLCTFFDERKSSPAARSASDGTPSAFDLIFCGQAADAALHEARCTILAKTVSLATQLRCGTLLTDTAAWMQKTCIVPNTSRSSSNPAAVSSDVKMVCCRLVNDYGSTGSVSAYDTSILNTTLHQHRRLQQQRVISDLATLAPGLLPFITASAMSMYDWFATPPLSILEVLTDWICSYPKLLLKPFKDAAANKSTVASPPTFLRALSQGFGKLLCLCLVSASAELDPVPSLYGRLQLGLLRLMEMTPKFVPWPSALTTTETPYSIITPRMAADMLKLVHQQQQQPAKVQNACYALFRALQMGVATKCFSGTKRELEQALSPCLNDYPFLEFVLGQQF